MYLLISLIRRVILPLLIFPCAATLRRIPAIFFAEYTALNDVPRDLIESREYMKNEAHYLQRTILCLLVSVTAVNV